MCIVLCLASFTFNIVFWGFVACISSGPFTELSDFSCSPVDGHLNYVQFGGVSSKASINISLPPSGCGCGHMSSFSLGKYTGLDLLDHNVRCIFNFLRSCHVFPQSCAILNSHQKWGRALVTLHSLQRLVFSV